MTCCLNLNFSIPYSLSLDVQSSQQVQFRLSENFCFSLELVFLLSELSLSVIKKKQVPNSHLQKNDSHQFQSLQSLRALVQPNNWSQKKKKKTRIAFVISVGSGSSDSLYTTKLQPAVFINILLHANTETVEKYPEIFLVAF